MNFFKDYGNPFVSEDDGSDGLLEYVSAFTLRFSNPG